MSFSAAGEDCVAFGWLRDAGVAPSEIRSLIDRHLMAFYPVPPMEVSDDGKAVADTTFILQHEPSFVAQAIDIEQSQDAEQDDHDKEKDQSKG